MEIESKFGRRYLPDIERLEREYAAHRHINNLPPLLSDRADAEVEMATLYDDVDVVSLHQGKAASGAEAVLHVKATDLQRQFDHAMKVSGLPRGSVESQRSQINRVVNEVTSSLPRGSTPHRRSSAHGSH